MTLRREEDFLGNPVFSLQTMLRQISLADPQILPVIPDGRYGRSTYASVRSFQQARDLPATGNADRETWEAISGAYGQALLQTAEPRIRIPWPQGLVLQAGEENRHIHLAQAMLTVLAADYPALTPPALTGKLDPETAEALRWIQAAGGLPVNGELDAPVWQVLIGLYGNAVHDGT